MRLFLFLCLFLCACSGKNSVPQGVLSSDKMGAVLYDVIRADEMVEYLKMSDSTYRPFSKRTSLYDTIFQLHHIRKEDFQKSLRFYQGRPDLLKEMLDELQKKVSADTSNKHGSPELLRREKRFNQPIVPK